MLLVEVRVIPLADGDADRRDWQFSAIAGLLQGVLTRRSDLELTSRSSSHLISSDGEVLATCRPNKQQRPDRVGSPGQTSGAGCAPCQTSSTSEAEAEGSNERWITKQQLARHLGFTVRWIEYQQRLGLPYLRMGGMNRYRASEVEAWLRDRHAAADSDGGR
ncbi:MAG TPA: hypothetical protein VFN85_09140 [Solirubrobacterales bacterium]|nr:hypothetical protein [Solirubrobacterales bacterium]